MPCDWPRTITKGELVATCTIIMDEGQQTCDYRVRLFHGADGYALAVEHLTGDGPEWTARGQDAVELFRGYRAATALAAGPHLRAFRCAEDSVMAQLADLHWPRR